MSQTMVKVGTEGLYLRPDSGTYFARFRLHGKQHWRSLETKVLTQARIKLRERMVEVEKARAAAAPSADLQTLGDCERLLREGLTHSQQSTNTKRNYLDQLDALAKHWPVGDYATMRPADVTREVIARVRTSLVEAPWKVHNARRTKHGYSNAYVNQCLSRLRNVLSIARSKGLCTEDPFAKVAGLHGSVLLPNNSRIPQLPRKEDMNSLFAEIARVTPGPNEEPAFRQWRRDRALDAAEHVRFMAFSGMRVSEANRMKWEDIITTSDGTFLRVEGFAEVDHRLKRQTKTDASADRRVPVVKAMSDLLDEIKARRTAAGQSLHGRILVPHTSLNALAAACKRLKLKRLKQHDLRHYFATICIESGIPIPTLSGWLGHSDGGALCQRTYGHLRQEHSAAAAKKVTF